MKSIKKLGKDLDLTKTKFLQKYGSTEKTVDEEFEEQREKIEKLLKFIMFIDKEIKLQDEAIRFFPGPLLQLSEDLTTFYSEDEVEANGTNYRNSVMSLDMAIREYLEKQKEFYFNLEEHLNQINTMKKKIQERDNICLDHDKWKTAVIKLTAKPGKDPAKLWEAEKKFEEHKELYLKINAETKEEMKEFYAKQNVTLQEEYKMLIVAQSRLFLQAKKSFDGLLEIKTETVITPQLEQISQLARRSIQLDSTDLQLENKNEEDLPPQRAAPPLPTKKQ
jgi:hypothetical protein